MIKKRFFLLAVFASFVTLGLAKAPIIFAQPTDIQNRALSPLLRLLSGAKFTSLLISHLITILFIVAATVAVIFFLVNGIKVITAGGNKEQHAKGREGMTAAFVGLVILFLLYVLLQVIEFIFGINLLVIDITHLLLR